MNEKMFNAILFYGNKYREEHLFKRYDKDQLLNNWWEALKFFFDRAFYQGRRDTVSEKVCAAAVEVLEANLPSLNEHFESNNWEPLRYFTRAHFEGGTISRG